MPLALVDCSFTAMERPSLYLSSQRHGGRIISMRIQNNRRLGLHTLCLLDIRVKEQTSESSCRGEKGKKEYEPPRFMTVNTAISQLLEVEELLGESAYDASSPCIGVARLGSGDQKIVAGPLKKILEVDLAPPLHCLVIAGETHPMEDELLDLYRIS